MIVEGIDLDLNGLELTPGLVNAHDHLHFSLFPRLGSGPYSNATEWARDIYHPDRDPVRSHLGVPKHLRLIWGGLRNLLAGVTTVCHHDQPHPVFDSAFPVRVMKDFRWAHSLAFTKDVRERFEATPADQPFIIHLGEGTDKDAAEEIFRLHEMGVLTERTVLVHAVGLTREGWDLVRRTGAAVIWCPRSNLFTLGRTLPRDEIESGVRIALGTDSSLTTEGDLLDEIRFVESVTARARAIATVGAYEVFRIAKRSADWIAAPRFGDPPQLVVIGGELRLISARLAAYLPRSVAACFHPIEIEGRPPVLVRWDIPALLEETSRYLNPIRLAGRIVLHRFSKPSGFGIRVAAPPALPGLPPPEPPGPEAPT